MAKKRVKKRTHVGAPGRAAPPGTAAPIKAGERTPKSMVIRIGASEVGPSISQLVKDVRSMMEPGTATRLRERRSNKLRDYTTMAGPLGVTHLMLFSRSDKGNVNMRLALTPRGPTLHFRVEKYSLCKDVQKSMKHPKSGGAEFLSAPLLVMNNFATQASAEQQKPHVPKHLESLTTSVFQSLFPPLNPTTLSLKSIKRVLLLDREQSDDQAYVLNLRHFAIETRTAKSVPKPLRRLDAADKLSHAGLKRKRGGIPNLSHLEDAADYLLDPEGTGGFTSGSESEPETDAEVEVQVDAARRVINRKRKEKEGQDRPARSVEKKAVKMHELGPRLRLRLTKVEEGVCGGKVMWHEYITKTPQEIKAMEKIHAQRKQEKDRRRVEQKANVERKKAERKASGKPEVDDEDEAEDDEDMDDDEWDSEGFEDDDVEGGAALDGEDEDEEMDDDAEGIEDEDEEG